MKAKLLSQQYQKAKENCNSQERKRMLHLDLWRSQYVTDLPMKVPTDEAYDLIYSFICSRLNYDTNEGILEVTLERNGLIGLWQFTVLTDYEIAIFEIG